MELSRAKRQLQSMLMMNLEERGIVLEDIGRQVLSNGERKQPQEFVDLIGELHPFQSDTLPKVTAFWVKGHRTEHFHIWVPYTLSNFKIRCDVVAYSGRDTCTIKHVWQNAGFRVTRSEAHDLPWVTSRLIAK